MNILLGCDKWPKPTKSILLAGPDADSTRLKKEYFIQREAKHHECGMPVLVYFDVNPTSISITNQIEAKHYETKGKK